MSAPQVWNAATYDAPRRRLVPDFDAFYGTAALLVERLGLPAPRVLDLGAGTGLLSRILADRLPDARFTLFDASVSLLDVARTRLAGVDHDCVVGTFADGLPAGPFDAVVSALSIHHLPDDEKRQLIHRAFTLLRPGGVFINADQIAGPTASHSALNRAMHEAQSRALGSDDAEWNAAVDRMSIDLYATIDDHLAWFRSAGFERGDCFFKRFGFAVMAAWRPAAT